MSQLTTHILDTTRGMPAKMVTVILLKQVGEDDIEIARGITNKDGRVEALLPAGEFLPYGTYKLRFDTKSYFEVMGVVSFYPRVEIIFEITTNEHYHVPLLLNPFGYSTYRGS